MTAHKDLYGILKLLAMEEQENLKLEFGQQVKKVQKIINSCLGYIAERDAYEFIYENIWEKYFEIPIAS